MKAIMIALCSAIFVVTSFAADSVPTLPVDGQPLGANITRLIEALEYLGQPLDDEIARSLRAAAKRRDAAALQEILDDHVLFVVSLNPEVRVKVARGPAAAKLQHAGYTCHIVKVLNNSTVTRSLRIMSPQSGPVYAGAAEAILKRQAQTELKENENTDRATDRFLELEMYNAQPMSTQLSGLEVEYALAMIYCSESGQREATIGFDVGAGTQDIGFRGELPVLFDVRPAKPLTLRITDVDGAPTTARLTFRDKLGHVYPPQMKRLAPDFFFQPQIYRGDVETVLLPSVDLEVTYNRGPEYKNVTTTVALQDSAIDELSLQLERWVNPMAFGFYCGDHHIHGAGCSHYDNPTQGVTPRDMFAQVKGEGLNVGVAFAAEQPNAVAYGGIMPSGGRRVVGDTRLLHAPRDSGIQRGGNRMVEIIVNGNVVDAREIPADGQIHDLNFRVPIEQSSWVALRQFPQLHTNPVNVIVAGKPIRASRASARWCEETIHLLWKNRERFIAEDERPEARATYDRAIETYRKIAAETAL